MLLAFDTSGPHCTVVLAQPDGSTIAFRSEEIGRGHAERLMALAEDVLDEAQSYWQAITLLGCTTGPGSFTGLRVGLAATQGLILALNKPRVGVSVFDVLALACAEKAQGEPFCIIQDARRDQVYHQSFDGAGKAMTQPAMASLDEIEKCVPSGATRVAGTGASLALARMGGVEILAVPSHPTPHHLAAACATAPSDAGLKPLYLRAADAKPQKQMMAAR